MIRHAYFAGCAVALALAASLLPSPARAAEADKYLPNDTEVVLMVNVRQILDSPLVKKHALKEIQTALKGNSEVQKTLEALGFDPLKDVSSLLAAGSDASDKDKWLTIVHGKFDTDKFHAKAEEVAKDGSGILKTHKVGDYKIYEVNPPGQDQSVFVALVDKGTLVASPGKDYVVEAHDKGAGKKKSELKKDLKALLEKADAKQSITVTALGETLGKGALANNNKAKELSDKIKAFTGGITVADDVKAEFVVASKDADAAKDVADEINAGLNQVKGLLALFAMNQKELEPVIDVLGTFKVSTDGSNVRLKCQVTKELIEKSLKKDQ